MHIDEDDLELYALRRLEPYKWATLEEHLLVCDLCCERLDRIEGYLALLRAFLRPPH
jgi:hypothetical protein